MITGEYCKVAWIWNDLDRIVSTAFQGGCDHQTWPVELFIAAPFFGGGELSPAGG